MGTGSFGIEPPGVAEPAGAAGRPGRPHRGAGYVEARNGKAGQGGAPERAQAAGRPRVVPDPPQAPPPLPADPELVRLARVPLPAETARRQRPPASQRAG